MEPSVPTLGSACAEPPLIERRSRRWTLAGCCLWLFTSPTLAQETPPPHVPFAPPTDVPHTASLWTEPHATPPWSETMADVVISNDPGLAYHDVYAREESPARRDLGNLIPPGARPGFFQKVNGWASWMPQFESDGLGMTAVTTNVVTAVPFFQRHQPLVITPEYTLLFLEGPDFIDVPARLHEAELKFNHIRRLNERWVLNAAVTVGVYADDHSFDSSDAVRVSGRAVGIYEQTPFTRWLLGVAYINRADTRVVPVLGWTYTTDDLKYELIVPLPRVAWRTWSQGAPGYDERWWYVRGMIGGGIWSVQRDDGTPDTLNYSDFRVIVGTERIKIGGISHHLEFGYVFGRELEFDSVGSDFAIDDTIFARAGFAW